MKPRDLIEEHQLPRRVDKRLGAELVSRFFFPVAPRYLQKWPVPYRVMGRRSIYEVADLFEEAERRLNDAPLRRPEVT